MSDSFTELLYCLIFSLLSQSDDCVFRENLYDKSAEKKNYWFYITSDIKYIFSVFLKELLLLLWFCLLLLRLIKVHSNNDSELMLNDILSSTLLWLLSDIISFQKIMNSWSEMWFSESEEIMIAFFIFVFIRKTFHML